MSEEDADPQAGVAGPLASPGYWLRRASARWTVELDRRLGDLGLTHAQFELLGAVNWLGRDGTGVSQQAVAAFSASDRGTVSRVLRTLERRGLVARTPDPESLRSVHVRTTTEGAALVGVAAAEARAVDALLFGDAAARAEHRETLRRLTPPASPPIS